MSWDDEDFSVPTSNTHKVSTSWEDELDDEPVLESWDIDSEEEREKEKEKQAEQAAIKKKKDEEAAKKKAEKDAKAKRLLELDTADPKTRKELLKKAELESDLNNAADLFGGLGVADEHPRAKATRLAEAAAAAAPKFNKDTPIESHPLFDVETKQDFIDLRKALAPGIINLAEVSQLHYASSFAIDLIRDMCGPLNVENLRKLNSTLSVLTKEKEKQERQLRLSKAGTSVGGAGKKKAKPAAKSSLGSSSFKKDLDFDTTNYDDEDFGEDDFM